MAAQVKKSFQLDYHTKTVSMNTYLKASKMQNLPSEIGQNELLKELIRKRISNKGDANVIESKAFTESKKTCISGGEELLKVVRNGTEKLNIKESSKSKPSTHSKKMCFCSPTTHEGSFRCNLHRISAAKKSTNEKNSSNLRVKSKCTTGMVEFKPQLSRFGRIDSAEVGHDSLIQLPPGVESA